MKVNNHEASKITDDPRKIFNTEAAIVKLKSKVTKAEEVKASQNDSQTPTNDPTSVISPRRSYANFNELKRDIEMRKQERDDQKKLSLKLSLTNDENQQIPEG
jgi:primase-polymerase (primpol)-like protein